MGVEDARALLDGVVGAPTGQPQLDAVRAVMGGEDARTVREVVRLLDERLAGLSAGEGGGDAALAGDRAAAAACYVLRLLPPVLPAHEAMPRLPDSLLALGSGVAMTAAVRLLEASPRSFVGAGEPQAGRRARACELAERTIGEGPGAAWFHVLAQVSPASVRARPGLVLRALRARGSGAEALELVGRLVKATARPGLPRAYACSALVYPPDHEQDGDDDDEAGAADECDDEDVDDDDDEKEESPPFFCQAVYQAPEEGVAGEAAAAMSELTAETTETGVALLPYLAVLAPSGSSEAAFEALAAALAGGAADDAAALLHSARQLLQLAPAAARLAPAAGRLLDALVERVRGTQGRPRAELRRRTVSVAVAVLHRLRAEGAAPPADFVGGILPVLADPLIIADYAYCAGDRPLPPRCLRFLLNGVRNQRSRGGVVRAIARSLGRVASYGAVRGADDRAQVLDALARAGHLPAIAQAMAAFKVAETRLLDPFFAALAADEQAVGAFRPVAAAAGGEDDGDEGEEESQDDGVLISKLVALQQLGALYGRPAWVAQLSPSHTDRLGHWLSGALARRLYFDGDAVLRAAACEVAAAVVRSAHYPPGAAAASGHGGGGRGGAGRKKKRRGRRRVEASPPSLAPRPLLDALGRGAASASREGYDSLAAGPYMSCALAAAGAASRADLPPSLLDAAERVLSADPDCEDARAVVALFAEQEQQQQHQEQQQE